MPLSLFACDNCGFWQRHFATPPACPICTDVRNDLPEDGWSFSTPADLAGRLRHHFRQLRPDLWEFWSSPRYGLDGHGWLLLRPEGNVAFEAAPLYDAAQLAHITSLGGIAILAASHPHGYGALWQLQEAFAPILAIQKEDLQWTKAFRVTLPYDGCLELHGDLALHHTGGHYDGHAVLHDARGRALFAGDALKVDFAGDGAAAGISCHKAYHKQIPLTRDEARRYRAVIGALPFDRVFTPFEHAEGIGTADAVRLLDAVIEGPSTRPMALR